MAGFSGILASVLFTPEISRRLCAYRMVEDTAILEGTGPVAKFRFLELVLLSYEDVIKYFDRVFT